MMKVAEALLLSLTIVQPHSFLELSGSGVKLLPPVLAAHARNIESIVAHITQQCR